MLKWIGHQVEQFKHLFKSDIEIEGSIISNQTNGSNDIKILSSINSDDFCTIATTTNGATTITTVDDDAASAHFEVAADGDITLDAAGQIKLEPASGNNILLDGTIVIDEGVITGATSITSTTFIGTWFTGASPKIFSNQIKLIPSDFMANDDGGNENFGVGFVETAGGNYGMRTAGDAVKLFAFTSIPEGMKATDVIIYAKDAYGVEVFEAQINATTMTSLGTGFAKTSINITDTASTLRNFLVIQVNTTVVTDRVYGGLVTIAAQD